MRVRGLSRLHIGIVYPSNRGHTTGNLATAQRWQTVVEGLGCSSFLCPNGAGFRERWGEGVRAREGERTEVMVALNGVKSHGEILAFRELSPEGAVIVAVTGTDMNGGDVATFEQSLTLADHIVVLQEQAFRKLPSRHRQKARTIYQSVGSAPHASTVRKPGTRVCVVGHLRSVKDPMRCALATRLLPSDSQIILQQAGAFLEEEFEAQVAREESDNPRYRYLGVLTAERARELISESDLLVMTSLSEGGPLVVAEAVVDGTPVISSRIDGVVGLLGDDYPGYFTTGDERELADLLTRFERDAEFRASLERAMAARAHYFAPETERTLWKGLLLEAVAR